MTEQQFWTIIAQLNWHEVLRWRVGHQWFHQNTTRAQRQEIRGIYQEKAKWFFEHYPEHHPHDAFTDCVAHTIGGGEQYYLKVKRNPILLLHMRDTGNYQEGFQYIIEPFSQR